MGGDPAEGESVSARGAAGARGGRRGRCGGNILRYCSYSRASRGGRDGGGVGFHDGAPITIARVCDPVVLLLYRPYMTMFRLAFGVSLSSLIGEMEGKDREREEN